MELALSLGIYHSVLVLMDTMDQDEVTPCHSSPCSNGGKCTPTGSSFVCSCPTGYFGNQCQGTPCHSSPCSTSGTCKPSGSSFVCSCLTGYSGKQCQITPCHSSPCLNGEDAHQLTVVLCVPVKPDSLETDVKYHCQQRSSMLAEVTRSEMTFLRTYAKRYGETFWLGGSDRATEGVWVWTSSGQRFTVTDWHTRTIHEPNNLDGNEDCLNIHKDWTLNGMMTNVQMIIASYAKNQDLELSIYSYDSLQNVQNSESVDQNTTNGTKKVRFKTKTEYLMERSSSIYDENTVLKTVLNENQTYESLLPEDLELSMSSYDNLQNVQNAEPSKQNTTNRAKVVKFKTTREYIMDKSSSSLDENTVPKTVLNENQTYEPLLPVDLALSMCSYDSLQNVHNAEPSDQNTTNRTEVVKFETTREYITDKSSSSLDENTVPKTILNENQTYEPLLPENLELSMSIYGNLQNVHNSEPSDQNKTNRAEVVKFETTREYIKDKSSSSLDENTVPKQF
ncbi:unnamed protein product [Mytilus edulis]|uniref:Uncharacterized protein n=1 Tax=Mytilus edulis TaxID=6550 RepID=A0A8S3RSW7_MYTED|nr:unnamed protein product [Mytilus edulis]